MPDPHVLSPSGPGDRQPLDERRRRARYRAWHRGIREMDLVMGRFADREIATLDEDELTLFEWLLEEPDTIVYEWIVGRAPAPATVDVSFLRRIRDGAAG